MNIVKKLLIGLVLAALLVGGVTAPLLATSIVGDHIFVDGIRYLPGDTYWANTWTEVEYLGNGKYGATVYDGHQVFFDEADGNTPKKYKLTDDRPDYVVIQSAQVCTEIYPYYAKFYDVQHQEVRLEEERWVVQRLFKAPDTWRDVDSYNPVMAVEEYEETIGHTIKVTVTYDTDYGVLTVEYLQRVGSPLKHSIYFTNTSGSTQTFRVLQEWSGIAGSKVNSTSVVTSVVTDEPYLTFHDTGKPAKEFNISENLWSMVLNPDGTEKTDQCLQTPITIETSAQGMKADFIFGNWVLPQGQSLEIDPDTATLNNPAEDGNLENQWDTKETASQELQWGKFSPTTTDYIYRAYVEWDVSGIADGSIIADTVFKYEGHTHEVNCTNTAIKAILNHQPSTHASGGGAGQSIEVFNEIGTSAAYVASDAGFPVVAQNQSIDLGAGADTDLGNQLASDWFAIGLKTQETENPPNFATWLHRLKSEDNLDPAVPKPTLYVVYTLPPPTVTTQAATNIEDTTATGNGNITASFENCDIRGIVWDLASQGAPGNVAPGASGYANDIHEHGDFGNGAYTINLTSLPTGDIIYCRAYAHNTSGYGYGAEINFLTKPAAPTNVQATDGAHTDKVVVTWTKSTGATNYRVYEGVNDISGLLGDVATYDDNAAPAGTVTPGAASASDGTEVTHVVLSLAGEGINDGASRTYKVVASNATGNSDDSGTNTGFRRPTDLTYAWQRSAADADAAFGAIGGGTTDPYNDTGAPANGDGRWYYCEVNATGAAAQDSTHNRGFRDAKPIVVTGAASLVEETTATLNGEITNIGGANATTRGFEWDIDSGAPYANDWHQDGDYGVEAFNRGLSLLTKGEKYFFRAYAINTYGTSYGSEVTFLTKPDAPNTFIAVAINSTKIDFTWNLGTGATKTYIRGEDGSYPTDRADGWEVFFDVGTSASDTGLTGGHTYYYKAWGWAEGSEQYSDLFDFDYAYTPTSLKLWFEPNTMILGTIVVDRSVSGNAGAIHWGANPGGSGVEVFIGGLIPYSAYTAPEGEAAEIPIVLPEPTGLELFEDPGVDVSGFPAYGVVNRMSASLGWTVQIGYSVCFLIGATAFGFGAMLALGTIWGYIIGFGIVAGAAAGMDVLPAWVAIVVIIALILGGYVWTRS